MVRLVLVLLFCTPQLWAMGDSDGRQPKIELGLGGAYIRNPSYPGADKTVTRVLAPLPFVIYRGDIFRADRSGGYRAILLERGKLEFDIGFGGGFSTDSEDGGARDGMEELDYTIEMGPRAKWTFINNLESRLQFHLPARYVFSLDFDHTQYRGWVFNPELNWRRKMPFARSLNLYASVGASWATKKLMDYFYTVKASEAIPGRPAYRAQAGYWGANTSLFLGKSFKELGLNIFGGMSWSSYDGSENTGSPLLRDRFTSSYFVGLTKVLWKSKELQK